MVKLEVKNASSTDKGVYNLVAKNEKGEVVSQPIEVKEVPEEKAEKPSIDQKLKSIVSNHDGCGVCVFVCIFLKLCSCARLNSQNMKFTYLKCIILEKKIIYT